MHELQLITEPPQGPPASTSCHPSCFQPPAVAPKPEVAEQADPLPCGPTRQSHVDTCTASSFPSSPQPSPLPDTGSSQGLPGASPSKARGSSNPESQLPAAETQPLRGLEPGLRDPPSQPEAEGSQLETDGTLQSEADAIVHQSSLAAGRPSASRSTTPASATRTSGVGWGASEGDGNDSVSPEICPVEQAEPVQRQPAKLRTRHERRPDPAQRRVETELRSRPEFESPARSWAFVAKEGREKHAVARQVQETGRTQQSAGSGGAADRDERPSACAATESPSLESPAALRHLTRKETQGLACTSRTRRQANATQLAMPGDNERGGYDKANDDWPARAERQLMSEAL